MSDQKKTSLAYPKLCISLGDFFACLCPMSNSTWLKLSAVEWIDSANMAVLPVINDTTYFITAISRLPARAKIMALFDPWVLIRVGVMVMKKIGLKTN